MINHDYIVPTALVPGSRRRKITVNVSSVNSIVAIPFMAFLLWAAVVFGHAIYGWAYATTTPKWHSILFFLIGGFVVHALLTMK